MTSPSPSEAEGSRIALTSARWRGAGLLSPLRGGGEPDCSHLCEVEGSRMLLLPSEAEGLGEVRSRPHV
jgi:hypothetical protein